MRAIHHTAIVTDDVETSLRFWRDGLGLTEMLDHRFSGDWRTLFDADADVLRSIFLGDSERPDGGIIELVQFVGTSPAEPDQVTGPQRGLFLVSLQRDVEPTLSALAELGFTEGVRRIAMPAPGSRTVAMAVITAPDGVRVELIGGPS